MDFSKKFSQESDELSKIVIRRRISGRVKVLLQSLDQKPPEGSERIATNAYLYLIADPGTGI